MTSLDKPDEVKRLGGQSTKRAAVNEALQKNVTRCKHTKILGKLRTSLSGTQNAITSWLSKTEMTVLVDTSEMVDCPFEKIGPVNRTCSEAVT